MGPYATTRSPIQRRKGVGETHEADEPDPQEQRPPEALDHPGRYREEIAQREECTVREEVPVRLVLHLAERGDRRPQVGRAREKGEGVAGQVELGVGSDQAGRLNE